MLPHQSVFLGEHRGNVCIYKINMNHSSPWTHSNLYIFEWKFYRTPSWYTFRKNDDHVLLYKLQENEKCQYLKWQTVSELTQNYMPNFFSKGHLSHYPNGFTKRFSFVSQKMLKNVPAYLQSRKELHSSLFEEIHKHRFFWKDNLFS